VAPGERRAEELTMNKLAAAPTPVMTVEPETHSTRPSLRKLGWGLLGAAAAMAIVGAGCGIGESSLHQKAVSADPMMTKRSQIDQWKSDGDNLAIGAWVGLSVGAAALTASVIVFILDGKRGETHEAQKYVLAPSLSPHAGGLTAAVRF
jgi:hypothetical protein